MTGHRSPFTVLFLVLLVLALPAAAPARVFSRWTAGAHTARALAAAGGETLYRAKVTVNNGRGELTVFGFDEPLARVTGTLARSFDLPAFAKAEGDLAVASCRSGDRVVRLVAARLFAGGRTLLFALEQSEDQARASRAPPAGNRLGAVPAYPGSEPLFFVKDEKTRAALAVSRTDSGSREVQAFLAGRLADAGWTPVFPASGPGVADVETPAMKVYLRNESVCCLLVQPLPGATGSRITLLHKPDAME